MEAIFPKPVGLGYLLVDGVGLDVFGEGLMERRVKEGDAPDGWNLLPAMPDNFQGGVIV